METQIFDLYERSEKTRGFNPGMNQADDIFAYADFR